MKSPWFNFSLFRYLMIIFVFLLTVGIFLGCDTEGNENIPAAKLTLPQVEIVKASPGSGKVFIEWQSQIPDDYTSIEVIVQKWGTLKGDYRFSGIVKPGGKAATLFQIFKMVPLIFSLYLFMYTPLNQLFLRK